MAKHGVVSADSHIDLWALPFDTFTSRVPKAWRERVPHVVQGPEGVEWVAGERGEFKLGQAGTRSISNARMERMLQVGFDPKDRRPVDPELRIEDQEKDGVDGEVIYGIFSLSDLMKDRDAAAIAFRAYNEYVAEFSQAQPDRFCCLGIIPGNTVEAAIADLEHIAELGLRGAQWGYLDTVKPIWHPYWEPFWAAAAERQVVISLHAPVFGSTTTVGLLPHLERHPASYAAFLCVFPMQLDEAVTSVIFSGTLERNPALKVVLTESGVGWIPYLLERMDHEWHDYYEVGDWKSLIDTEPSQLFRDHIYATFQTDTVGPRLAADFCPDNFMWGSDYPHPDGVWPDSKEHIGKSLAGLSDDMRRKIVNDNVRAVYRMEG